MKTDFFQKKSLLNCRGKLLDVSTPKVMGILNVTPDSFYDGGKYQSDKAYLNRVEEMLQEGASMIDIGGMSTRPGAAVVQTDEELKRVIPVIEGIVKEFGDAIMSIDTIQAKVAKEAVEAGASIVNDVSAGTMDEDLLKTVAQLNVPYILMHMKGTPKTMQQNPSYENAVLDVMDFFVEKTALLRQLGIDKIILDVGFGFGKTLEHNYQLLKSLDDFKIFEMPMLVGLSRKSMIYKFLEISPQEALNGTTALHTLALLNGANILRVHDVKEAMEAIRLMHLYQNV